jgi:hypothetical protein
VEASVVPNAQNPESTEFTEAMTSAVTNGHVRSTKMKRGARSKFQKGILRATVVSTEWKYEAFCPDFCSSCRWANLTSVSRVLAKVIVGVQFHSNRTASQTVNLSLVYLF